MDSAIVTEVYEELDGTRVCAVPDVVLQIDKTLIVYAYIRDKGKGETLYTIRFNVVPREIPSDYIANQDAKYEQLDERVTALEEKVGEDTVDNRIDVAKNELIDGAPSELNTLNKIANAIGNDPDFKTNVSNALDGKVDKVEGKELSSNDFTDFYKGKLDNAVVHEEIDQTYSAVSQNPQSGAAVAEAISTKVDIKEGYDLSKNDFTDEYRKKLDEAVVAGDVDQVFNGESAKAQSGVALKPEFDKKVDKVDGMGLTHNDFTQEYIDKINGAIQQDTGVDQTFDGLSQKPQSGVAIKAELDKKVSSEPDKGLSTNDFTTVEKEKLANIADQATRVLIDKTLQNPDQAADAKAVNDRIANLKISEIENDSGYITTEQETDPTVPDWAKVEPKPDYSYFGAEKAGTAETQIKEHDEDVNAHGGIVEKVDNLILEKGNNNVVYQPEPPADTSQLWIDTDDNSGSLVEIGNIYFPNGIILTSSNNTKYRLIVGNDGTLSTEKLV